LAERIVVPAPRPLLRFPRPEPATRLRPT